MLGGAPVGSQEEDFVLHFLLEVSQTWKMGGGTIKELGRQDNPPGVQHPLARPLDVHCCWAPRSHLRRTYPSDQSGGRLDIANKETTVGEDHG